MIARAALVVTFLVLVVPGPARAQSLSDESAALGGPPPWAYEMAHDLMSPFCPGRTLAACPSGESDQLRQWILLQAAAGQSREQLEADLLERFGDAILSAPRAEGVFGVSAYVIPIAGFLLGLGLAGWLIARLARRGSNVVLTPHSDASASAMGPQLSDEELERLVDEEFARS